MWLPVNCLYIALLGTCALSYPVDNPPTEPHPTPRHSNGPELQTDAPFYLEQLISPEQVAITRDQYNKLGFKYSWNKDVSGKDVVVYVVGVDVYHPEFGGRATNGWTFSDNFIDNDGHGTLCASIVGGKQFGVAKNCGVVIFITPFSEGKALTVNRINGLQYVLEECTKGHHACIVSMSMGIQRGQDWARILPQLNSKVKKACFQFSGSRYTSECCQQLIDAGIHVVAAAGNDHTDHFPSLAGIPGTITVGALDCFYQPAESFSNYGKIDIWAVGTYIKALFNDNYWSKAEKQPWVRKHNIKRDDYMARGTSLATPQVAGIIAIIISFYGNMPPAEMKNLVIKMSIHDKIRHLYKDPYPPYGPNVMAHIPKELYSLGLAA